MKTHWNTSLVLQLPCHGSMGTARDLEFRHELESVMAEYFAQNPIGTVTGGDIGMGKMNVFLSTSPTEWERVLRAIKEVIRVYTLDGFIVVARIDPDVETPVVVYPEGSTQPFSVL